jgi:hypothetical protein
MTLLYGKALGLQIRFPRYYPFKQCRSILIGIVELIQRLPFNPPITSPATLLVRLLSRYLSRTLIQYDQISIPRTRYSTQGASTTRQDRRMGTSTPDISPCQITRPTHHTSSRNLGRPKEQTIRAADRTAGSLDTNSSVDGGRCSISRLNKGMSEGWFKEPEMQAVRRKATPHFTPIVTVTDTIRASAED